jgi:hypothetical protein
MPIAVLKAVGDALKQLLPPQPLETITEPASLGRKGGTAARVSADLHPVNNCGSTAEGRVAEARPIRLAPTDAGRRASSSSSSPTSRTTVR